VCLVGYLYQGIELVHHLEDFLMMCEKISHVSLSVAPVKWEECDQNSDWQLCCEIQNVHSSEHFDCSLIYTN
jgi:hypothetical protein